ncbi:MAG TPA: methyltransferase [Microvirga sp.]|jgi:tRNA1(Val) A37 N6-methylase TrmN6|nr:methyltransferase [Microvirga sp.]
MIEEAGGPGLQRDGATEDALLGGRVRLLQPARGHRAGTDAVLLSALATPRPGEHLIDVGAATGAVGLMVAARVPGLGLTFVERDPDLADLCRRNLALNGACGRVAVADILDGAARRAAGLASASAALVLTNPPYLEEGRARASPDPGRAGAHMLPAEGLAPWLRACAALVAPKGTLALIHRADRLADCLAGFGRGFGGVRLRLVHPRADAPATRLLLSAVKGSRAPLRVEAPLVLHDAEGRFTPLAAALHRGEAALA